MGIIEMEQQQQQQQQEDNEYYYDSMMIKQILDKDGDELTAVVVQQLYNDKVTGGSNDMQEQDCSPAAGARQIIQGNANVVSVLPVLQNINNNSNDNDNDNDESSSSSSPLPLFHMETTLTDKQIPFPNDIIIVPGSYNPPHHGHVALANAAVAALRQIRQREEKECNDEASSSSSNILRSRYSSLESFAASSSSSSSAVLKNLWNTVDKHDYDPTVLFEMSVTNADKPPLDPSEVGRRVNFFPALSDMPNDWGVILTNAPLFSQKASLLEKVLTEPCSPFSNRKMTFVLGTDTFVRIINPKYYNNSLENMIDALVEMKMKGVHFIVGGRLDQQTADVSGLLSTTTTTKFINGEEEIKSLPGHVQEMFTLLTEEEFRLDVSSTEIRKQMER